MTTVLAALANLFNRRPAVQPAETGLLALEVGGSGPRFIGCLDRLLLGSEHRAVLFDERWGCIRFTWSTQTIPFAAVRSVRLHCSEGQRSDYGYELRLEGKDGLLLAINDGRRMRASDAETVEAIKRVAAVLAERVGVALSPAMTTLR